MPKISALTQAYNNASDKEGRSWRTTRVSLDALKAIATSSNCHSVSVSAPVFGLVDISVDRVLRQLEDEWFVRQLNRIAEKHGTPCVADISIHKAHVRRRRVYDPATGTRDYSDKPRAEAFNVLIHWFGVQVGEYLYTAS